jgi:protein TonB
VRVLGTFKETAASIAAMDSPRSGFRRAAATSWALAGVGIVGVAGASALAYADTVKALPSAAPADEVEQALAVAEPSSDFPAMPAVTTSDASPPPPTTTAPAPEVAPETTVDQAPVRTYTPEPNYVPDTTVAQAPVTHQTSAPTATAPRTTQRRSLTPTTVMAPNFSPRISRSRGS